MTEEEWLASTNPEQMLRIVGTRISLRKQRLFACACCRRHWSWVEGTPSATAVEVSEAFADGRASDDELQKAATAAANMASRTYEEFRQGGGAHPYITHVAASACGCAAGRIKKQPAYDVPHARSLAAQVPAYSAAGTASYGNDAWKQEHAIENAAQARELRDIIGNPFHVVAFEASWRTSDVMLLAQGAYDERAFDRLPILADALQDAGCTSEELLNHLRDTSTTHVRGCWAVDVILGKE